MRQFRFLHGVQVIPTQPVATILRQILILILPQLHKMNKPMMELSFHGPHQKWKVFQDGIS